MRAKWKKNGLILKLNNVEKEKLGKIRKQEYEEVKELNKAIKNISTQTIENSKYYSRIAYYNSLEEENKWNIL